MENTLIQNKLIILHFKLMPNLVFNFSTIMYSKKNVHLTLQFLKFLCLKGLILSMIFFRPCSLKSQTSCFFPFSKNAEQLNKTELNQLLDSANYKLKLEKIKTYLKNNLKGFNGSILLVSKDSIAFELSKGYAEKSSKTINESSTLFELASVSKQFTAASILLLEADGKLKITDSLSRYLIDFPYPGITIHHLLTH